MWRAVVALCAAIIVGVLAVACGGGSSTRTGAQTGFINTSLSDPATCQAPKGPYDSVYITVVDAKANTSASAGDNDAGWVDLTPNLSSNPKQIDLLGLPLTNQCFLAILGSQTQLAAGTYQQIRLILLDNNHGNTLANNKCTGNDANCVVLHADQSVHTLLLSSEAQTGIKIPSGQIAGGQFTVPPNDTADLNIDINCCASIVITGNGQYRLKPVLHAGEVSSQSVTAISIRGRVVNKATSQPLVGGNVVVALEQLDSISKIDRVVMETVTDAQGNFVFCPVPDGTYDVVAVGIDGQGVQYAATVTTGLHPGTVIGDVPLNATTGGAVTILGKVTTTTGSAGAAADISLSALQPIGGGNFATVPNVPLSGTGSATVSLTTASGSCPANTDCASYNLSMPGVNPFVGAFVTPGPINYTQDTVNQATITLDALAFVVSSGNVADCSPPEQKSGALNVNPGDNLNPPDLAFLGCNP